MKFSMNYASEQELIHAAVWELNRIHYEKIIDSLSSQVQVLQRRVRWNLIACAVAAGISVYCLVRIHFWEQVLTALL